MQSVFYKYLKLMIKTDTIKEMLLFEKGEICMRIFRFDELDSTNIFLKNLEDKEDYDTAIAKVQTLGRGRRGNKWSSEPGGAYFSFLIKENKNIAIEEYTKLPLVAGYSLLKSFQELEPELDFKFKWTNDIYINDKKISGILVEKIKDFFVIGIGINVNNEIKGEAENTGTSLKKLTLKEYDTEKIIISIIEKFKNTLNFYFSGNWDVMLSELNEKNYLKDKKINIVFSDCIKKEGIGKYIHKSGQLAADIDGKEELFNVGEIHISKNK